MTAQIPSAQIPSAQTPSAQTPAPVTRAVPAPFGQRLAAAMAEHGPLCAGIDPHPGLLRAWGLDDDPAGLERFALTTVEAVAGRVAAVKPQAAFFERHGSAGVAVLERVIAALREAGTLCIVDAKRGDIGSTMAAYADAYAGDSPLAADAVTATAYLGWGSLTPLLDLAHARGRGVFVLALTSNPQGAAVQHATDPATGSSVAHGIARAAGEWNLSHAAPGSKAHRGEPSTELGSVGLVVGATIGDAPARLGIDLAAVGGPLLAPGIGAQGATAADLAQVFGSARPAVLAASSREILAAGPAVAALREAALRSAQECRAALAGEGG